MRHLIFNLVLGLTGTYLPLFNYAQFQLASTDLVEYDFTECVNTTDGGVITQHMEGDSIILRKHASDGTVMWNRALVDVTDDPHFHGNLGNLCRDGSGGAFFGTFMRTVSSEANGSDPDTSWHRILVVHVQADGTTDAQVLARSNIWVFSGHDAYPRNILIDSPDGASVLIGATYDISSGSTTEFILLNVVLQPVWARSVGLAQDFGNSFFTTESQTAHNDRSLAFAPDGSLFYAVSVGASNSNLEIKKLASNGDLAWSRYYRYTNTAYYAAFRDITVDSSGNVHAVGRLDLPTGSFSLLPTIRPDGQLHRAGMYRTDAFSYYTQIDLTNDGRRLIRSSGNTMLCDTLGSLAPIKQLVTLPFGDQNVHCEWWPSDLFNDSYCASGTLVEQHQITSFTNNHWSVVSANVNDLGTCFHRDTSAQHYDVLSIMTQEDLDDIVSVDVSSYHSVTPATDIVISAPPPPDFTELCSFVIGMDDASVQSMEPLVRNNVVIAGTPFDLSRPIPCRIEVLDVSGRVLHRIAHNGSSTISTNGWADGAYLLRAIDNSGRLIGAQRVVVQ